MSIYSNVYSLTYYLCILWFIYPISFAIAFY